jgi:hypothetical protein
MAFVVSGSIASKVEDGPEQVFRAGEAWWEPVGAIHRVSRNAIFRRSALAGDLQRSTGCQRRGSNATRLENPKFLYQVCFIREEEHGTENQLREGRARRPGFYAWRLKLSAEVRTRRVSAQSDLLAGVANQRVRVLH